MKKLKVLLALITRNNDYQREQASAAEATAKRLNIDLKVIYAEGDAIAQTQQLFAALRENPADRPDAIVVEPVGTAMSMVGKTAVGSGVGWVVMNNTLGEVGQLRQTSPVPVGSINTDNLEVGRIQGKQFAALLPSGGAVLYVEGPATDVAKQRRTGLQQALPPNVEIQTVRGKWTEDSAFQAVSSRLALLWSQAPNVGIIGCQNDAMAMGARKAVESLTVAAQREQWLKIPFTGCDGVPASGQVWVRRGLLTATIVTPPLAGMALELVSKAAASGTQMPEVTLTRPVSFPPLEELRAKAPSAR